MIAIETDDLLWTEFHDADLTTKVKFENPARDRYSRETVVFSRTRDLKDNALTWTVDLIIGTSSNNGNSTAKNLFLERDTILDLTVGEGPHLDFVREQVLDVQRKSRTDDSSSYPIAVKFVLPKTSGQVVRSDIFQRRLECCNHVDGVVSFLEPLERVSHQPCAPVTKQNLLELLASAVCVIKLKSCEASKVMQNLESVEHELLTRLSLPWLLEANLHVQRIAWVQGREDFASIGRAYDAAHALGISLVIFDEPGHWLENDDGPYAYLREAFIPMSIDIDDELPHRVVDAVKSYHLPIDGIVTISDVRLRHIAEACEILGLPTSSSLAHAIAEDKFKTRQLELDDDQSIQLDSALDLQTLIEEHHFDQAHYPLIVKPCRGWNSDCVTKVNNEAELIDAVKKASQRHQDATKPSTAVIIEPYISGPEVDINLVILEGQVLFFEVNDDFPSTADDIEPSVVPSTKANFQETQQVIPSALPSLEIALLRDSVRDSILRQGFQSGIFHCEARVRNSSMQYQRLPSERTLLDLQLATIKSGTAPSTYLHEINARPPGYIISVAVLLAWGIDYYALRLLYALGPKDEEARIRALSIPFIDAKTQQPTPQFNLSAVMVPQTQTGILKTANVAEEFLTKHSTLKPYIVDYRTHQKAGAVLEGSQASSLWWMAHFAVSSRESRLECLKKANFILENFDYQVETEEQVEENMQY